MANRTGTNKRRSANTNPWYLLATLYGAPSLQNDAADADLQWRNQTAWNRYMAVFLSDQAKAWLLNSMRFRPEEIRPFSEHEAEEVRNSYVDRCHRGNVRLRAPPTLFQQIDFTNLHFDTSFAASRYLFPAPVNFSGTKFSGPANFTGATFIGWCLFRNADFTSWVNFPDVEFVSWANFGNALFSGETSFHRTTFRNQIRFTKATFYDQTSFRRAAFLDIADFRGTEFADSIDFEDVNFSATAGFDGARFSYWTSFRSATFANVASFIGARFSHTSSFERTTFYNWVHFENVAFESPTTFEDTIFGFAPPFFFGAKLQEGTVWRGIRWPRPKRAVHAGQFIDAYERLKLEMDRLRKHEDELNFFALEQQSRRILKGIFSRPSHNNVR